MFESGLSYVRTDFHLHTHKDKEFVYDGEDNSFVKTYIASLKEQNIGVGVITNHNKFDMNEYKALRKAGRKEDIFILPGVELTIKEGANGIHTLIVFNPDEWIEDGYCHISTFLTSAFATIANPENKNTKSTFDLRSALTALDNYGKDYFIIFAHVDQNNGLFSECKGGLLESLSGIPSFSRHVIGLQKLRTTSNMQNFKKCFGYDIACVEGSDPKSIREVGKGEKITYLKIGEYSYSAVKFALQDFKNRVSTEKPVLKHGYISSVMFQGGKFDGQTINFSPELNTLIGIRGSGKSSVLEAIRYVFDISAQTDLEYKKELIKNVLGSGGKITLKILDKHGKSYKVSRILGEHATVVDSDNSDLNLSPLSLFDNIQYFGQKDLSQSADHEFGLLEKLVSGRIDHVAAIETIANELSNTVTQLLDVSTIPSQIEEYKTKQTETEHKMSIYKERGIAEKLQKQTSFSEDSSKLTLIKESVDTYLSVLKSAYGTGQNFSVNLSAFESKYNADIIKQAADTLSEIDKNILSISEIITKISSNVETFSLIQKDLSSRVTSLADEFAEIKREIKDDTLDLDGYVKLSGSLGEIKNTLTKLDDRSKSKNNIETDLRKSIRLRNEALLGEYQAYERETQRINKDQRELRIDIEFKGDREGFKNALKSAFKGTGLSELKYQNLCDTFPDFVSIIEDWLLSNGEKMRNISSPNEYIKLDTKLRENYRDLISQQVRNSVNIYYHDKLLRQHSIGQRAFALILFILMQNDNDVILIDQPEDDLDNKVIYDEVIRAIINKKTNIQFIFATHNANIPVLGDAERVLTVEYQDKTISVSEGNIDLENTHHKIVEIMEGGQEAFERRHLIYTSWK